MSNPLQIEKVHLTAADPAGETFAVVSYPDGRCGITRDGKPVPGLEWPADRYDECAAHVVRLARLNE